MDTPITRRKAFAGLGSVALGSLLAGCGGGSDPPEPAPGAGFDESASCTLTAEQTEGPYYLDADALRSDIREDREGKLLRLSIRVRSAAECAPLADAVVDVWHCDASGGYSGVQGDSGTYLRGSQVANAEGIVEFRTIYPGWYPGRTPHIHVKVHLDSTKVLTTRSTSTSGRTRASTRTRPTSRAATR